MVKDINDMEIIARVTGGEINMFELLVGRYSPLVFAIAGKRIPQQDVPSVAQAAFVAAWRSLPDYEGRRPFANWLSVIAMRCCCDYWRQRGAAKNQTVGAPPDIDMQDFLEYVSVENAVDCHERESRRADAAELADWLLKQLKPEERLLMDMVYWQRRPLKEAAETLDWSIAKTKIMAMRARRKMRLLIAGMDES